MLCLNDTRRAAIARDFAPLIGLPLTDMWRYGCQKFEFGEQRRAEGLAGASADWGLVASQRWRIEGPGDFLLCDADFDPERRDDHAAPFYARLTDRPLVVERLEVLPDGALRIGLTDGFSLAIDGDPECDPDSEIWRLMPPEDDPRGHLVVDRIEIGWSRPPAPL